MWIELYYYELRVLRRYRTVVLPDTFIVHKEHAISDDAAKFREVTQIKYSAPHLLLLKKKQLKNIFRNIPSDIDMTGSRNTTRR